MTAKCALLPQLILVSLTAGMPGCTGTQTDNPSMRSPSGWIATRSNANPLLTTSSPGMIAEHGYQNANGPSVIRAPDWIKGPLGRYYMYFAHHRGSFIRMAYADSVEGPWTVFDGRPLELADTPGLDHIASPDVHVDPARRVIRMYYHTVDDTTGWIQSTYAATSTDGLRFESQTEMLGPPYVRAFKAPSDTVEWAVAKVRGGPGGLLLRRERKGGPFQVGPLFIPGMRHAAVLVEGDLAHVFFSRIGDEPERLLVTTIDPARVWDASEAARAHASQILEILRPETGYEGADLPIEQSAVGEADRPVHALRDPAVFSDGGRHYLFYSIAGENGIAVALLQRQSR